MSDDRVIVEGISGAIALFVEARIRVHQIEQHGSRTNPKPEVYDLLETAHKNLKEAFLEGGAM